MMQDKIVQKCITLFPVNGSMAWYEVSYALHNGGKNVHDAIVFLEKLARCTGYHYTVI